MLRKRPYEATVHLEATYVHTVQSAQVCAPKVSVELITFQTG
jgi:hypothetical protein